MDGAARVAPDVVDRVIGGMCRVETGCAPRIEVNVRVAGGSSATPGRYQGVTRDLLDAEVAWTEEWLEFMARRNPGWLS